MKDSNQTSSAVQKVQPIVMSKLPSLPFLLGKAAFKVGHFRVEDSLPDVRMSVEDLRLDSNHLQRYREICGFDSERMPATYLFVVAFPLFVRLMLEKNFPLRPMGQVHLSNNIAVHHCFDINSPLSISAAVGSSELTSRGLEWNIDTVAEVEKQTVWSAQSTFLYRCKTDVKRKFIKDIEPSGSTQQWMVPANIGRRYARISGDYNPIHIADTSARVLGFKKAIAHGMWSKARCLAALDSTIPDAGYQVDVRFHKPVFLPSSVQFYAYKQDDVQNFSLFNSSGTEMHLKGSII